MKRDKKNVDDFIRRNLPRASREEVEEAGARVLSRLHRDMQDQINSFKLEEPSPLSDFPEWMTRDIGEWMPMPEKPLEGPEYLVLRVVSLLGGEAYLCSINDKVRELCRNFDDFIDNVLMIHSSLHRLLYRGYLRMGTHGFPPKGPRVAEEPYQITPAGVIALQEAAAHAAKESKAVKDEGDGLNDFA